MRDRRWVSAAALLSVALLVGLSPLGALQAQDEDRERVRLHARVKVLETRVGQLERLIREQAVALEALRLRLDQRREDAPAPQPKASAAPTQPKPSASPKPAASGVERERDLVVRARDLVARAKEKLAAGRPQEAFQLLELAISFDPRSADAHFLRGQLLARMRRYKESLQAYARSLELEPRAETLVFRAYLLHYQGDVRGALTDLRRAQALAKQAKQELSPDFFGVQAQLLCELERWQEAEASAQRFLKKAKSDDYRRHGMRELVVRARLERVEDLYERRDDEQARALLAEVRTSDAQQSARAALMTARLAMRARPQQTKVALEAFAKALELAEGEKLRAQLHFERGVAYFEARRLEEAITDLTTALEIELPADAVFKAYDARYVLARCYELRSEWAGVCDQLRRFLAEAPKEHPAREKAERILARARQERADQRRNGPYGKRYERDSLVLAAGGSDETEAAVDAALAWLARAQSTQGFWDTDNWTGIEKHPREGHNAGDARYDVGLTSLALLAYAGRGDTHQEGRYRETCAKALRWLLRGQKQDGSLGFGHGEEIYNHAIATAALCELYGLSGDPALLRPVQRAVRWCLEAQNPNLGWQYGVRTGKNDTSVTAWMTLALDAARTAGVDVPERAFSGAVRWFKRATASSGEVGYMTPGGGSSFLPQTDGKFDPLPVMTGSAVFARVLAGEEQTGRQLVQGGKILSRAAPVWEQRKAHFYYWFFGTYAMHQLGGKPWQAWNTSLCKALLGAQARTGAAKGSWAPIGEWCLAGGRVYATAINALTLQVYYRVPRR